MKIIIILLVTGIVSFSCNGQPTYKSDTVLVKDFVTYIKTCAENKNDITDVTHLKFILLHYLFVDRRLDSTNKEGLLASELTDEQLVSIKKQLHAFADFLQETTFDVIPAYLAKDTYIYNHLTSFQKKNTIAFIDKSSGNIIAYILIMPPMKRVLSTPRIWSWSLIFQYGKYMFRSVTGEEGYEYFFKLENRD